MAACRVHPGYARAVVAVAATLLVFSACRSVMTFDSHQGGRRLTAVLRKPDGPGPFPAVVLMHGCGGIQPGNEAWANDLTAWGYATLLVDSFTPRGLSEICTDFGRLGVGDRTLDAYAALDHLRSLPFIDEDRIALMGWSHGGRVVLFGLSEHRRPAIGGFRAGVALYPYCDFHSGMYAPLLILIGDADDWTPAVRCDVFKSYATIDVKVYRGAPHSFDNPGPPRTYLGHALGYDHAATADARKTVREFLARHLAAR
jgi:dienelactone hydrolase